MFFRDYVINFVRIQAILLIDQAIFAAAPARSITFKRKAWGI